MQLGLTVVGVVVAALVSDFGEIKPKETSRISSLYYLFFNLGAIVGVVAPTLLVITSTNHAFWWFLVPVSLLSVLVVMAVPRELFDVASPDPEAKLRALASVRSPSSSVRGRSSKGRSSGRSSKGSEAGEGRPATAARAAAARTEGARRSVLATWAVGREYRAFRLVVFARTLFYFAAGIFQAAGLFYVNSYIAAPPDGERILGTALAITLVVSVVCAVPAGWASGRFGAVACVMLSSIALGVLFGTFSFLSSEAALLGIAPLLGIGLLLFAVADLSLIIDTLPDPRQRARDIGLWNAFQYVGNAIGAAFTGPTLTAFGYVPGAAFNATATDAGATPPYSREGYRAVFWVGAAAIFLSCAAVYRARRAILARDASSLADADAARESGRETESAREGGVTLERAGEYVGDQSL